MPPPAPKPAGRRPGPGGAKDGILAAARELFAADGLEATSVRAVARRADVDPALVLHYFGDKQRLFREAMTLPIDADQALALIIPGPRGAIGRRLVAFFLSIWDDPARREVLTGILKAATTSATAAELLRHGLTENVLEPVGRHLDGDDQALRVGLCSSHLIGLGIARYVIGIEPIASASPETLIDVVGRTLQGYLTGRL